MARRILRPIKCICGSWLHALRPPLLVVARRPGLRGTSGQTRPTLWPGVVRAGEYVFDARRELVYASDKGYERARELVEHALQISPDLAEAHALLAYIYSTFDWDWAAAKAELQRALAIDPTNHEVLSFGGILSRTLGRWDDAERQFRARLVRDPLNFRVISILAGPITLPVDSRNLKRRIESCSRSHRTSSGLARTLARHCWRRASRKQQLRLCSRQPKTLDCDISPFFYKRLGVRPRQMKR